MHIVKELIDNILSTSLNRFLTEQKIANEQRLSFFGPSGFTRTALSKRIDFC